MKINNETAKKKIFIVEESDCPTESLVVLVSNIKDYDIVGYTDNKKEALRKIIEEKPNVVILDIMMSGGKSFHFIYKVRQIIKYAKIIIFASHNDGHYRKAIEMLNVDNFLDRTKDIGKLGGILTDFVRGPVEANG